MATRKRGPIKVDLTGIDGAAKIDAEYNPIINRYFVRIENRKYNWTASEFSEHIRKWLVRQKS